MRFIYLFLIFGCMAQGMNNGNKNVKNVISFMRATASNSEELKKLLNAGASDSCHCNPRCVEPCRTGFAFWGTVIEGRAEACELFIAHGARIHCLDRDGRTFLMKAARHGQRSTCSVLIKNGIDLYASSPDGWDALEHAIHVHKHTSPDRDEICKMIITAVLKTPTSEQKKQAVLLMGILKKKYPYRKDTNRLIAQQFLRGCAVLRVKQMRERVNSIEFPDLKAELTKFIDPLDSIANRK